MQNLIDFVDLDGDGAIDFEEFARVVEAEDVLSQNRKPPHPFGLK